MNRIVVHPSFSSTSSSAKHNIALLRLATPLKSYRKLCLPSQDSTISGAVTLVGWRISAVVGSLSQSLESLDTTIVQDCGAESDKVCTAVDTRCQGDTGAPLVRAGETLVGAMTGRAVFYI